MELDLKQLRRDAESAGEFYDAENGFPSPKTVLELIRWIERAEELLDGEVRPTHFGRTMRDALAVLRGTK